MGLLLSLYYQIYRFFIKKTCFFEFTGSKQEDFGSFVYFSRYISSFSDIDTIPDGINLVLDISKYKNKVVKPLFHGSFFTNYLELSLNSLENIENLIKDYKSILIIGDLLSKEEFLFLTRILESKYNLSKEDVYKEINKNGKEVDFELDDL